jgi:hypothetical protein
MSARAWFSRQVSFSGNSDFNQGRPGETEIPHSDQWIHMPPGPKDKVPEANFRNVLHGKNPSGVTKIMVEDIFQGQEYRKSPDFHHAEYVSGRWIYEFPENWANSNTQNKAIAVRRITTKPRTYAFTIWIQFETAPDETHEVHVCIPTDYSIQEALSTLVMQLSKATGQKFNWDYTSSHTASIHCAQNWRLFTSGGISAPIAPDFCELLNIPEERRKDLREYATLRTFPNVWDRRDLFIHGSFVTSSAQGYLGRHGEFYTQPNKLYYADFPTKQFYLEVSYDGFTPVQLPYENFIIELTFLIDEEEHVG